MEGDTYSFIEVTHSGEIVTLYIDGIKVSARMWAPYRFPVEEFLTEGLHTIILEITEPMVKLTTRKKPILVLY